MEIHLTQSTEEQLRLLANRTGDKLDDLLERAVGNMLAEHERFRRHVEAGIAQLDAGEFVDHAEVGNRIRRLLET